MATITKHVGVYGGKPCVVVFRELPQDLDHALIISSNSLDGQFHDDVMSVIDSEEAQSSNDISEVLHRRRLSDGENMLNALHTRGKLQRVPVDMVTMTPYPNQEIALKELNAEIRKIQTGSNPPLKTETNPTTLDQPVATEAESSSDDPTEIAKNLLAQASLIDEDAKALVADAEAKRQEAYRLDPELAPKRGPGRPPKASIDSL
jgi:hypothetical protein